VLYTNVLQHILLIIHYLYIINILPSSSVYTKLLAKPKSATFTKHSEFINILDGLRSLCMSSPECTNFRAFKI
jgi:hypothetical protein